MEVSSCSNSPKYSSDSSLLDDFWSELDKINDSNQIGSHSYDLDDENMKSVEGEAEADWLCEAGLENIVSQLKGDEEQSSSCSLDELLAISLSVPLTPRQAKTVKKRFNTLRSTLTKQKRDKSGQSVVQIVHGNKHRPDVRTLFGDENSHTNEKTTNQVTDELDGNFNKGFKYTVNAADPETISNCPGSENNQMPGQHKPIEYGKYTVINDDHQHFSKNHLSVNEKSPKKESSRFSWSGYKKAFKVTDKRRHSIHEDNNSGVEMLSLKYVSSMKRAESFVTLAQCGDNDDKNVNDSNEISDQTTPEALGIVFDENKNHSNQISAFQQEIKLNLPFVVRLESFNEDTRKKIKLLAHIELTTVLDAYELDYEKFKVKKQRKRFKKTSESSVFGMSLNDLFIKDKKQDKNCVIPFVLEILTSFIRFHGLNEEGIFRVSGTHHRLEDLKKDIDHLCHNNKNSFFKNNKEIVETLTKYSIYDVCGVLKQLIRDLPDPLLSYQLLEAFLLVPKIDDYLDQLKILNLLILLLNEAHRNSLEEFIALLKDIVANEDKNKMTIHNIATVIAPNLFPNLKSVKKKMSKGQEQKEMSLMLDRAQHSIIVTKMFIYNLQVLFQVPPYLVNQIKHEKSNSKFY